MRASHEGHARRKRKQTGVVVAPPRSRLAKFRVPSIDVIPAIREDGGAGGIQADGLAESAPTEKGVIAADSATPEEVTPVQMSQRHLVSVEREQSQSHFVLHFN